jgi:hypothetical protein
MSDAVTRPTSRPVEDFLAQVEPPRRRDEGQALDVLFRQVTGFAPRMWGPSMVGYGRYAYRYDSGHSGESFATGFSPRKAQLVVYILPGYADYGALLSRLGPHKLGKSCLYLSSLAKVDQAVLAELIRAGLQDLARHWTVLPE